MESNPALQTREQLDRLQIERNRVASVNQLEPAKDDHPLVVFMTPSIDHMVTLGFLASYVETITLLNQNGWATAFHSVGGDPYLAKVRNLLVSVCLKKFPTATHLFFLDADIEWDAASVLRVLNHPADIVAGIYPKKTDKPDFPCDLMGDKETGKLIEEDGLYRAIMVPTGFLRVRREVYVKMAEQAQRYRDGTGNNEECWNIFEMGFSPEKLDATGLGEWWGEDFAWCRKAQNMGYKLLVDPDCIFGHRGAKTWRHGFQYAIEAYKNGKAEVVERTPEGAKQKVVESSWDDSYASDELAGKKQAEYAE